MLTHFILFLFILAHMKNTLRSWCDRHPIQLLAARLLHQTVQEEPVTKSVQAVSCSAILPKCLERVNSPIVPPRYQQELSRFWSEYEKSCIDQEADSFATPLMHQYLLWH